MSERERERERGAEKGDTREGGADTIRPWRGREIEGERKRERERERESERKREREERSRILRHLSGGAERPERVRHRHRARAALSEHRPALRRRLARGREALRHQQRLRPRRDPRIRVGTSESARRDWSQPAHATRARGGRWRARGGRSRRGGREPTCADDADIDTGRRGDVRPLVYRELINQ